MKSQVSITRCSDYESSRVKAAVKEALDLIGSISHFVKVGQKVLIKPNLLSARLPEEAVDTHPEFVRAVVQLVREAGGIPSIGDSPGSFFTVKYIDEVYERSGIKEVADKEGATLIRFDEAIHINGYPIAKAIKDFDLIINLPKLKTHTLSMITGAVKNTFGFVPGLSKVQCHKKAPNAKDFAKIIVDIFSITKPALSIMDGIVGMDGDGPAAGRVRKIGLVLASADGVSMDAVFAGLVGLPYSANIVIKEASERGIGNGRLQDIEVKGVSINSAGIKDFKLPKTEVYYKVPGWIARPFAKLIHFRPFIKEKDCKKCNICKASCPVDAITITDKTSCIDEAKCVKCFCCHEVCPYDAIYIKKNMIAKMIWQ